MDTTRRPRILFIPGAGAWGPFNALRAMAEVVQARGQEAVFAVDTSFQGRARGYGYEEHVYPTGPPTSTAEDQQESVDVWVTWFKENQGNFNSPTLEQLRRVILPQWQELLKATRYARPHVQKIIEHVRPDLIIIDSVGAEPAVVASGVPWVRSMSANPLELVDPELPPAFSGYSLHDRSQWPAFRDEYRRLMTAVHAEFNDLCVEHGGPPLEPLRFAYDSPWLNLYTYPRTLDYPRPAGFHERYHRLDTVVRTTERRFRVDDHLPGVGPVLYLSLGSLGSLDKDLLQHLVNVVAQTGHRTIVSTGPFHDQIRLGANMYGESFLPQPNVLPGCDLLITHGGSNTLNEGIAAGLPMIVLPFSWDGYDNAQRIVDLGLGHRLNTYRFEPPDLVASIESLLADEPLRRRMKQIRDEIQQHPGRLTGGNMIADLAVQVATVQGEAQSRSSGSLLGAPPVGPVRETVVA